jgi:hypothetical protein
MKKEIYIEMAKGSLDWVKGLKKEGRYSFNIKMHYMSKLDGITEIAVNDHELKPNEYQEILNNYRDVQSEMWEIESDIEKEEEI